MPYSKAHKEATRLKILQSAQTLFSENGFDRVTVNDVMVNCSLTRGAFYAHFESKSDLYGEALKYSAATSALTDNKPEEMSSREWLGKLLDTYLSLEHVNGERPCPMAFLANDVASRNDDIKEAYETAYVSMNIILSNYVGDDIAFKKKAVFPITSMIIGAVAVSRTIEDVELVKNILDSCRQQAGEMLGGV